MSDDYKAFSKLKLSSCTYIVWVCCLNCFLLVIEVLIQLILLTAQGGLHCQAWFLLLLIHFLLWLKVQTLAYKFGLCMVYCWLWRRLGYPMFLMFRYPYSQIYLATFNQSASIAHSTIYCYVIQSILCHLEICEWVIIILPCAPPIEVWSGWILIQQFSWVHC